jgi:acyl-coenzyme A thioesterase PaaI-like protein
VAQQLNRDVFEGFAPYAGSSDGTAPDYEKMCEHANTMVPFSNHVGTRMIEISPGRGVVEVPAGEQMHNHMGSVHAGAQFLAAELAGAMAFGGAFAPVIAQVKLFLLRSCTVSFLKPGLGRIRAVATLDPRTVADVLSGEVTGRIKLDGKAWLYDDNDTAVGKVYLDYVVDVLPDGAVNTETLSQQPNTTQA